MTDWLQNNRTWIFTGAAVAVGTVVLAVVRWFTHRKAASGKPPQAELETHEGEGQPQFAWTHAVTDLRGGITRKFQNEGSEVSNLQVQTTADVRVEWHPKGSLSRHEKGWVRFTSKGNEVQLPLTWTIDCRTALGQAAKQVFHLTTVEGQPELVA